MLTTVFLMASWLHLLGPFYKIHKRGTKAGGSSLIPSNIYLKLPTYPNLLISAGIYAQLGVVWLTDGAMFQHSNKVRKFQIFHLQVQCVMSR